MTTQTDTEKEIMEGKIYAVMSYWFFLCIIPFVLKKENKFAVFHGRQGLVLFIFLSIGFLFSILPLIGGLFYKLTLFIYMLCLLFGTLQSLRGRYSKLPIIYQVSQKINI